MAKKNRLPDTPQQAMLRQITSELGIHCSNWQPRDKDLHGKDPYLPKGSVCPFACDMKEAN
ncbi:hypothetical protein [Serratia proteamaculans]|uniref:hypothetical protein n=1 Tax=Serratia proteamaculans TaxID=28151 RepID=UPI00217A4428|nr:hypothetical protein [Serratia proteamaculans]CAI1739053.1 Uncharacterised protein [Serratia proteamaculans]